MPMEGLREGLLASQASVGGSPPGHVAQRPGQSHSFTGLSPPPRQVLRAGPGGSSQDSGEWVCVCGPGSSLAPRPLNPGGGTASLVAEAVKNLPAMQETWV